MFLIFYLCTRFYRSVLFKCGDKQMSMIYRWNLYNRVVVCLKSFVVLISSDNWIKNPYQKAPARVSRCLCLIDGVIRWLKIDGSCMEIQIKTDSIAVLRCCTTGGHHSGWCWNRHIRAKGLANGRLFRIGLNPVLLFVCRR